GGGGERGGGGGPGGGGGGGWGGVNAGGGPTAAPPRVAKGGGGWGYARASNRLYKENLVEPTRSELYAYDGLNQLTSFQRGTLNGTKTALVGSASRSQSWDFDALGNFDSQTTDAPPAQPRTHNKQNEITSTSSGA